LVADRLPSEWLASIEMTGEGSLSLPGLVVAALRKPGESAAAALEADAIRLEGISTGGFEFAGPFGPSPPDSSVKSVEAPRRSPNPPGIDAEQLRFPQAAAGEDSSI
jgi:hypothetical protein